MYTNTSFDPRFVAALNTAAERFIERRHQDDWHAYQLELIEALTVHLGRSSIPTQE